MWAMPLAGPAPPPCVPLLVPFSVSLVFVVPFLVAPICVLGGGGVLCHGTIAISMPAMGIYPLPYFFHVILFSDIGLLRCHKIWCL